MDATLVTYDYGESTYGERLTYSKPKYRDVWAGILYILQVIVVIGICAYLWITQVNNVNTSSSSSSTMSTLNLTGIFITIIACMCAGTIFGVIWLQIIKKWAGIIIKSMLFINIGMWIVLAVIGIVTGNLPLAIIAIILALFWCLWTWCVWKRIPFASALLSISSTIVQTYPATIFVSLAVIVMQTLWFIIWVSAFVAYIIVAENKNNTNNFIVFLFLISLYWGFELNKNVSHTTTCGVAASWYFSAPSQISNPTAGAFKRTITTSFGSVALGSFIVAFLEAVRAMLRGIRNSRRGILICIAICLLQCIERIIRFFNKYAFAHCAIYGTSFWQSAKATWDLFKSRGMMALINDDLSGMALMAGAFLGFIVSGLIGFFLGSAFYSSGDWYPSVPIWLAIFGAIVGYIFCISVLLVISSSIVCLFVCYSEDPAVMAINRPAEYQRVSAAKAEWTQVYDSFGGRGYQPQHHHQQQHQQQQTTVVYQQQQPVLIQAQDQQQQQIVYAPSAPLDDTQEGR